MHFLKATQNGVIKWVKEGSPAEIGGLYTEGLETCVVIIICGEKGITLIHNTGWLSREAIIEEFKSIGKISSWTICVAPLELLGAAKDMEHELCDHEMQLCKPKLVPCPFGFISIDIHGDINIETKPQKLKYPLEEDKRHRINILNELFSVGTERMAPDIQYDGYKQTASPKLLRTLSEMLKSLKQMFSNGEYPKVKDCFKDLMVYLVFYNKEAYEQLHENLEVLAPQMTGSDITLFDKLSRVFTKFKASDPIQAFRRAAGYGTREELGMLFSVTYVNNQGLETGKTALHVAAENRKHENIRFLLDKKADVNITDNKGLTVVDYVREIKDEGLNEIFHEYLPQTQSTFAP